MADVGDNTNLNKTEDLFLAESKTKDFKIVRGIKFQFKAISAVDFLFRTNRKVNKEEKLEVSEESIIIFELRDTNEFKNIFEHPSMVLSQDDAVQYLCGKLISDLKIEQDNTVFSPNGIQYEGVMGATNNRIRVLAFFKGIDLKEEYIIKYNDQLFDAGLIILKQNIKHLNI